MSNERGDLAEQGSTCNPGCGYGSRQRHVEAKRFFFEKKNQKTFARLASLYPARPSPASGPQLNA
jgi:hypothetical protein